MKYKIVILLTIFFASCAKKVNTQSLPMTFGPWEVITLDTQENAVNIKILNTLDESFIIHKPMEKSVSYQVDDGWEKVGILYCDCGSPCPPPPEQLMIEPKGVFSFSWDLQSEECESEEERMRTIKSKVPNGIYKAIFSYSSKGSREKVQLEIPFEID